MKIRIENDLLVFRLSESEKEYLLKKGEISSLIPLYSSDLRFVLVLEKGIDSIALKNDDDGIQVSMPYNYINVWDEVKVGFEEMIAISPTKKLTIIIEKDLKRSKRRKD
jgi:hypothetical protein